MPHQICKTAYYLPELSPHAVDRARDWFRETVFTDSHDWESVYNDAQEVAERIGIEFDLRDIPLMNGSTRKEVCIFFRGFSSQGDGASFEGKYRYKQGCVHAVTQFAPVDTELHAIVEGLKEVQQRHFYKLVATCKLSRGHYVHSRMMDVEVEHADDPERDLQGDDKILTELLRDFADWIYKQLREEYDYQTSDEVVDEAILANNYDFDEEGRRII